ncbi:MAG: stage II sporulation protein P [Firmicutes bacterium]|nr:stage II sporulation protein P [Bacillota bacterium]
MKAKHARICLMAMIVIILFVPGVLASATLPDGIVGMFERIDGGYFTLIDEETQNVVTKSARMLDVGDAYVNGDNDRFEVTRIQGDTVYVKNTGQVQRRTKQTAQVSRLPWLKNLFTQGMAPKPPHIALYCTHSDESYIPTSGVSSKEWGDVYGVMDALEKEFKSRGFEVDKSPNNHNPHDSQAYVRSRRTATQLLRERPLVIIDVHRDAVPENEYVTEVEGTELSAVQLVVGRQNQNREANLEFAQTLKDEADKQYPGLVKGIFDAKGNYNQDLAPRSLLLEFGTHETSLNMAEKAANLISDVLLAAAGASAPVGRAGSRSVWWIIGLVVLAAIAWVILNASGWEGVRQFFGREFTSAFGIGRSRKHSHKEQQTPRQGDGESHGEKLQDEPSPRHDDEGGNH